MLTKLRRTLGDVVASVVMTLILMVAITIGLVFVATLRYGTTGNTLAALRGETLIVRPASQSLGVVRSGETVSLAYSLTNLSSRPTRLFGSFTNCACTVPDRLPTTLKPRETRVVNVAFEVPEPRFIRPEDAVFRQEVTVYTSDLLHPEIALVFTGEVAMDPPDQPNP